MAFFINYETRNTLRILSQPDLAEMLRNLEEWDPAHADYVAQRLASMPVGDSVDASPGGAFAPYIITREA